MSSPPPSISLRHHRGALGDRTGKMGTTIRSRPQKPRLGEGLGKEENWYTLRDIRAVGHNRFGMPIDPPQYAIKEWKAHLYPEEYEEIQARLDKRMAELAPLLGSQGHQQLKTMAELGR